MIKRLTSDEKYAGSNSAYLYLPSGTKINLSYEYTRIASVKNLIPKDSNQVYKTIEGYSWGKEYFLLVPGSPVALLNRGIKNKHWYYRWMGGRYPAMAIPIPWAELDLIELFS